MDEEQVKHTSYLPDSLKRCGARDPGLSQLLQAQVGGIESGQKSPDHCLQFNVGKNGISYNSAKSAGYPHNEGGPHSHTIYK